MRTPRSKVPSRRRENAHDSSTTSWPSRSLRSGPPRRTDATEIPIGISVASVLRGGPLRRLLEGQLVVDESWAVSRRRDGTFDRGVLIGAGLVLYTCWVTGTAAGALGGEALGDPESLGLDAAFAALFLALLVLQVNSRRAVVAALVGGTIAFALVPFTAPGVPIIAATAGCLVGWRKR